MRKFRSLLMMAALLIVAVSCGKKYEIALSPSDYEFAPQGGELTVDVTTDGDWNLDKCPDWITASATSGNQSASIVLTAQPNMGDVLREGAVQVSTSTNSAQLSLKQGFIEENFISLSMDSISVGYEGGEFELNVISNCEWSVSSSHVDWVSVVPASGTGNQTVKITVAENITASEMSSRNAVLCFSDGTLLVPFKINQTDGSEVSVSVDPSSLRFAAEGGALQLDVTCTSNWTVSTTVPEWISISATEGTGNGQITVTAQANELYQSRLGAVVFVSDAQRHTTVMIIQDAAVNPHHLNVSPTEINFAKQGGDAEITVECDEVWKLDCPDSWISYDPYMGEGDGSFVLVAEENILNSPRNTVVNVVSEHFVRQIQVTQEKGDQAPFVSVSIDTLHVDAVEAVFNIEVSSNVSWTVRGGSWAQPVQDSGEGNGSFQLRVLANDETTPRSCIVRVVTPQGASASFVVAQSGYVYTLSTEVTGIAAPAEGLKTEVLVFANQKWFVSKGASWIKYDPISGTNDGSFALVVEPNLLLRDRSAEIYVTGEKDGLVIIQVNQSHAK